MEPGSHSDSGAARDTVERIFEEHLKRRSTPGATETFEEVCRRHPAEAQSLCALHDEWRRLQGRLDATDTVPVSTASASATPEDLVARRIEALESLAPKTRRYDVGAQIGQGGMGAVLEARDRALDRTLAMKVALDRKSKTAEPVRDPATLARFLEEARVTGRLEHPGIVPVHDLGLDERGRVFFTMKLVKGRDLEDVFDLAFEGREGWSETRVVSVLLKVCEAMAYAHANGVLHRDLKPANVMVGEFGEVYVMDWGLARVVGQRDTRDLRVRQPDEDAADGANADRGVRTMDGQVLGTPEYMPPEQALGETELIEARSDVYAMGAVLYHLLARRRPYATPGRPGGVVENLLRVRAGPPEAITRLRREAPAQLVAICEKAMSRRIEDRYADMLALAEDLRAYLENRVVRAYETGAWAETRMWVRRNRSLAAALLGVGVSLAAGLVVSLIQTQRADRNADLANAKVNEVLALSAFRDLRRLEDEAQALWPAYPDKLGAYDEWLEDGRRLVEGCPGIPAVGQEARLGLAALEGLLLAVRSRGANTPTAAVEASAGPAFADPRDAWWFEEFARLVASLRAFADPTSGLYSSGTSPRFGHGMVKRRELAATIAARSVESEDARQRWNAARAAIRANPLYAGLDLPPQLGLLPIHEDPESHLWEFTDMQTGEAARVGPTGHAVVSEESGLVFVLLPGGEFLAGAQADDPAGENYDEEARAGSRTRLVRIAPFFAAKFELTQSQWLRLQGVNRAAYPIGKRAGGHDITPTNPVEAVSWDECVEVLARLGSRLPAEAEWEYAARAGTHSRWWTGDDQGTLDGAANIADVSASATRDWLVEEWMNDEHYVHAPVGTYDPNPFGLHDVAGNVQEWCADVLDMMGQPVGSRILPQDPSTRRAAKGGGFSTRATHARIANQYLLTAGTREHSIGLRPARDIQNAP